MSYSIHRLGLPFCAALASLVMLLLPQTAPAQSQAPFWISCDAPADGAANICKEAGEAIAADQGWELSENIALSKLDDSELLASAQDGGARALVIRLKLHRSPGTEKRYAIEIVGAAQSIKRTYGMAKVSQLKDELARLGGVVLSTAMTAPEKAEDDSEAGSDEDAAEEPAAEEPAPEEPADEEPAEDEPAEAEAVEESGEDEAAVAEEETEEAVEEEEEEEEEAAAPRNRMESAEDDDAASDEEELAAKSNQGKEDAVENEKENPGGIAGACGGSSSQRRSRQQAAIPVLLTLLALGQFVRRRAGSSQQS